MFANLASTLRNKLTYDEWKIVAYYINKADDLGMAGKDDEARESLNDAIAVAISNKEYNAANKIKYYLRFY